jgi:phosphate ABC transporter phosphate-binding protein
VIGAVAVVVIIVAYGAMAGWFSSSATTTTLLGAGATFPYPLISKWSTEYQKLTGVQVNYQSIGSGGGIAQITAKTVDFGGTDAPMNAAERAAAPNIIHIPETMGAVVLTYNIPGMGSGLNFTGSVIADMFLGTVTRWNAANITSLNPSMTLPDQPISVVHRSDGSGTTFVWTDYLSKVSPGWASLVGKGKSVNWPVGIGAKGNDGVSASVSQTPYSVGYVELAYAASNGLKYAKVENSAGNFILPTLDTTRIAAENAAQTLPSGEDIWSDVSIVNPSGDQSYPISSFTYIVVYRELNVYGFSMTQQRAKALVDFLWWIVHDGQQFSSALYYVPLPQQVVQIDERSIGLITYNGQALR